MMNRTMRFLAVLVLCLMGAALNAQVHTSKWVKTYSWHGNGTLVTPVFKIYGESWRVVAKMNRKAVLNIQILTDKGNFVRNLTKGNPPMMSFTSWTMDGFTSNSLFIASAGTPWEVTVEQYMDVSQEWEYKAALKERPAYTPMAAWGGEADETFSFEAGADISMLKFSRKGEGVVRIAVLDETGKTVASNASQNSADVFETSIVKPGTYTVKITASVPWNATLYRPVSAER